MYSRTLAGPSPGTPRPGTGSLPPRRTPPPPLASYNAGSGQIELLFQALVELTGSLTEEETRHAREQLTEAELIDDEPRPLTADSIPSDVASHSIDPEAARRLWALSEELLKG